MRPMRPWFAVPSFLLAFAFLQVAGCGGCGKDRKDLPAVEKNPEKPDPTKEVPLLVFDDRGVFESGETLKALEEKHSKEPPTEIFLLAHGWNNSRKDALESYADLRRLLAETAAAHPERKLPIDNILVVGVRWPSKAFDEEEAWKGPPDTKTNASLRTALTTAFPRKMSPETYDADLARLERLLAEDTPENRLELFEIFRKYSLQPSREKLENTDGSDASIFDPGHGPKKAGELQSLGKVGESGSDLVRVFTFWQMKALAGIVGEKGLRPVLRRLQESFPRARFHLVGHSFGCKLLLSAVAIRDESKLLPRPIDSLVLIQGAISHQACAKQVTGTKSPGGYRVALEKDRVRGPIVATFTKNDVPLNFFYPWGSYLAKQFGELGVEKAHKYSALGAAGFDGVDPLEMIEPGREYRGLQGLVSVNGDRHITGHGDFRKPEVAWLIWAAGR